MGGGKLAGLGDNLMVKLTASESVRVGGIC